MTKHRPATPDQIRALMDYDPRTGALTWRERGAEWFSECVNPSRTKKTWNAKHAGKPALSVVNQGYRQGWLLGRVMVKAHHAAWAHFYGEWPTGEIDHINRDRSDNRICNLRLATTAQNCTNRPHRGDTPRGVQQRPSGKWMARIKIHGQSTYIGQFETVEEAIAAYNTAAERLHGAFAVASE